MRGEATGPTRVRVVPGEQEAREGGDSNLPSGAWRLEKICDVSCPYPLGGQQGTRSLAVLSLVTGSLKCDHIQMLEEHVSHDGPL